MVIKNPSGVTVPPVSLLPHHNVTCICQGYLDPLTPTLRGPFFLMLCTSATNLLVICNRNTRHWNGLLILHVTDQHNAFNGKHENRKHKQHSYPTVFYMKTFSYIISRNVGSKKFIKTSVVCLILIISICNPKNTAICLSTTNSLGPCRVFLLTKRLVNLEFEHLLHFKTCPC